MLVDPITSGLGKSTVPAEPAACCIKRYPLLLILPDKVVAVPLVTKSPVALAYSIFHAAKSISLSVGLYNSMKSFL
ncbi:hypothetical protein SDC9_150694 [bioreactor metagenome]|uniref:Uncharacterized protein n=1 Tax=bioreactor metagenome TaxID=1076179 RepID=A0A645ESI1_9ZZZZ